jgi:hypothetical protein
LTEPQQQAVGNCKDESCVSMPECLGVDCIGDDDCSSGQECWDYSCL